MKTLIALLTGLVLMTGCGKEKEPEFMFRYHAEGVEDERDLSDNYFPLYEDEYIEEFSEGGYVIRYQFDVNTHRAKWSPVEREDDWYDDVILE